MGFLIFLWNIWVWVYEIAITCLYIAFSLHYNYVSCILGVCAYLLIWVLIGLDWAFPMHSSCICSGVEPGIFVWRGQVAALIYLSRQPHTHIYTNVFFFNYIQMFFYLLYTHIFLFDKLYIYAHPKKKKKLSIFNHNYVW